jgi:hypothetical protein
MKRKSLMLLLSFTLFACSGAKQQEPAALILLKHFPLDSLEGVRVATGMAFDPAVSSDGNGSLRVQSDGELLVPLFEVTDVSIEDAVPIYQASLQSEKLEGQAYLEMWVRLPGLGESFSRGLDRPLTGTMSWVTATTPFFLQAGQKPDLIRLNLVVNGKGRVWIDDVRLLRQPLPRQ